MKVKLKNKNMYLIFIYFFLRIIFNSVFIRILRINVNIKIIYKKYFKYLIKFFKYKCLT